MPPTSPPPIALTSLKIRDFRGIDSLDLDFRGPDGLPNRLVVLAGPNGCGKTAVLEAGLLSVAAFGLVQGPRGEPAIRKGASDYVIRSEIHVRGGTLDGEVTSTSPTLTSGPPAPYWYFSSSRAPSLVGALNVSLATGTGQNGQSKTNPLVYLKQQLVNAAAARSFPISQSSHWNYSKWIAGINKGWEKFYPRDGHEFDVRLVESQQEGGGAFDVFFTRKDSPALSVDNLSSGQLELFMFLAALVLNEDREGIVFIDEPELHLDPLWHAPFMRMLMRLQPKAQFIVATHSHAIYAAAMSYERHFLVPDDDPRAKAWPRVKTGAEA